jgi:AraC-like DNA-binding protein
MEMDYRKIGPPDHLKNYVRYFWTLDISGPNPPPRAFRIIADGCPGLFFDHSKNSANYKNDVKLLPAIILYGQATRHGQLNINGQPRLIGACFYPNALKTIFGFDADELTDTCTDLDLLARKQGVYLLENLLEEKSAGNKIEIISNYLSAQLQKNNPPKDNAAHSAVARIIESNGTLSLSELQKDLGLSERSLERKFKQTVGIPPKLFSRIWRFQVSLEQLRKNETIRLSDLAYENEYADQSHFIRAFREFAGFSPNQFKKQSNEIGENFSELKS